jgi:hypothetical protein
MFEYIERTLNNGVQRLYRFNNGYGASVVQHSFSYGADRGLWELAVVLYDDVGKWKVVYDTEITDDVIGYLAESEIELLLVRINNLK